MDVRDQLDQIFTEVPSLGSPYLFLVPSKLSFTLPASHQQEKKYRAPLAQLLATASLLAFTEPCKTPKMQLDSGVELTRITSPFTLPAES